MRAYFLWTAIGPQLILTSCALEENPGCIRETGRAIGIRTDKYMAYEVPTDILRERYGAAFDIVMGDPNQKDELRMLDTDGVRVLNNIHFSELGQPIYFEGEGTFMPACTPDKEPERLPG